MTLLAEAPVIRHEHGCRLCCPGPVSGSRPDPCRYCGITAHRLDETGQPTHKVCYELAVSLARLKAVRRPGEQEGQR